MAGPEFLPQNFHEAKNPELMNLADDISLSYISESLPILYKMVKDGKGRNVTNETVIGRPDDDEIAIDKVGETVIESLIDKYNLPLVVYSENYDPFIGKKEGAKLMGALDPFDNSSEYKRGLPTHVYTCFSLYDMEGNPISGVIADLKDGKVWIASQGKVMVIEDFLKGGTPKPLKKSNRRTATDELATIAMYTGSNMYSRLINEKFRGYIDSMHKKGRTYANGGAHAPALLADGAVDLYIMPEEPVEETAAGHSIAHFSGMTTLMVNERNEVVPFKFDPARFRNDDRCLAVGATPEIAREGIDAFLKA